ncbi:MAG: DUF6364 family protein [Myxococcota bacterium]|nr:DUF6364 family protein [Myxococcota bacterium]
MNLTLSVDEQVVERARVAARAQGTSLNALIRQYLESLAGGRRPESIAHALQTLWNKGSGSSQGKKLRREDAYDSGRK